MRCQIIVNKAEPKCGIVVTLLSVTVTHLNHKMDDQYKMLWGIHVQISHEMNASGPDIIVHGKRKKKRMCHHKCAYIHGQEFIIYEQGKIEKYYQNLAKEIR